LRTNKNRTKISFAAFPAWVALALAGALIAAPAGQTQAAAGPPPAGPLPPVFLPAAPPPSVLRAVGLAQPVGAQVRLSWRVVRQARAYDVYRDGALLTRTAFPRDTDYAVAGGETHTYAVASVSGGREGGRSATATASVPLGGGQVVYADGFQNDWQCWGWAGMSFGAANPAPSVPAPSGHVIRVTAGPWEALYLHHAALRAATYAALSFQAHGGPAGGQRLMVSALRSGIPQAPVALAPLPAGAWGAQTVTLQSLGVAGADDVDGFWIQDATGTAQTPFSVDGIALTPAVVPAAPQGLTATPAWAAHCPQCGMPMPHILLAWSAVPGAASYAVSRDGAKAAAVTGTAWTDMAVTSGHSYTYTVTALDAAGQGAPSAPATAVAPALPAPLTAPVNLRVRGIWGASVTDALAWTPTPGAASYTVYQSDVPIAQGLTASAFTVPAGVIWQGGLFTVTATDAQGAESLPSAPVGYRDAQDPAAPPAWAQGTPDTPDALVAAPDWNAGRPRVVLSWHGRRSANSYSVYRDGAKVASDVWRAYYIDTDVKPGTVHTYAVAGDNTDCPSVIEGALSEPASATALTAAPAASGVKVQITRVVANDDSVVVFFAPVPGATDYRIHLSGDPSKVKYAGVITQEARAGLVPRTPVAIEWNGIDPARGADLVVEAVDKLGPFQRMDGSTDDGTASGMAGMTGVMTGEAINGQGDPSDVPVVLASSDSFHVDCKPAVLAGAQAFFDNFRSSRPFVRLPTPAPLDGGQYYGDARDYAAYTNDKWEVRQYGADLTNSKFFVMGGHFMDTTYDGGGPGSPNGPHNNDASLVMLPRATADLSGGKVLHVTFEVDAHFDSRRWCELMIGEAGDTLIDSAKFDDFGRRPTVSGSLLRWQIGAESHKLQLFAGDGSAPGVDLMQCVTGDDNAAVSRVMWDHVGPFANGTTQDLDKRHRFDLYLSKTHYRIQETTPDGLYNVVRERDFPQGVSLPFDKCQVYFLHQVYHTFNDRSELMEWYPYDSFWYDQRPFSDERHWDNLGFSVLNAFPS